MDSRRHKKVKCQEWDGAFSNYMQPALFIGQKKSLSCIIIHASEISGSAIILFENFH